MRKNPGRKSSRENSRKATMRKGDLNRCSTHKLRTHDGMVASEKFKRTLQGVVQV